jgi:hypothetical protein
MTRTAASPSAQVAPPPAEARLRVLLLADSCNPDWVSLPAVAYKACRAIAELADVVLVTNVRNEPAIARDGCGRARVVYIDNEAVAAPLHRLGRFLRGGDAVAWTTNVALLYPAYLAFERHVWRRFRSELEAGAFDLVHRLTPMSPTIPSPMASWSPVPFVLGRELKPGKFQAESSDEAVERVLDFDRTWSFEFPKFLMALDRIQKHVLGSQKLPAGDYRYYASSVECLFRTPVIAALEEYGIPIQVTERIVGALGSSQDLDLALTRLKQLDVRRFKLTAFETDVVEDAQKYI